MVEVKIDLGKCIGCKMCENDCVGKAIKVVDNKAAVNMASCIKCGHCEAVCPNSAVKLTGFNDEIIEIEEQTRLNKDELLMAIKTRRSIRQFKPDMVDDETINLILEAGRFTPTGTNSQKTSYVILKDNLNECEAIAVKKFRRLFKMGSVFSKTLKSMEIDDNFFFKKAPLAILVCGNDKISASLAAQSMAFMAEACGLGVLFSGFFTAACNGDSKIRKIIDLDDDVVTTLVLGYPNVKYRRTVHRNDVKVIKA